MCVKGDRLGSCRESKPSTLGSLARVRKQTDTPEYQERRIWSLKKLDCDDPDPALLCLFLNLLAHLAPSFSILEFAFRLDFQLFDFHLTVSFPPKFLACFSTQSGLYGKPPRFALRVTECLCHLDSCSLDHVGPFLSMFMLITFPGASQVVLVVKNLPDCKRRKRPGFHPCVRKIPWRRKWQPTPVFLPGKPHGQRSLAGSSSWGRKESDTTEETTSLHPLAS